MWSCILKMRKNKKKKPSHGLCLDEAWGLKASVILWCVSESPESQRPNQRVHNIQLKLNWNCLPVLQQCFAVSCFCSAVRRTIHIVIFKGGHGEKYWHCHSSWEGRAETQQCSCIPPRLLRDRCTSAERQGGQCENQGYLSILILTQNPI